MKRWREVMLRRVALLFVLGAVVLFVRPAGAQFHVWEIKEIYSNADGSVQYIELFSDTGGQTVLLNHTITADSDGSVKTFTFNANLVGNTANRHLLIATPGFAALPGALAPDYVLPCGPFFEPGATTITIDFPGADLVTFAGASLPTDGQASLTDQNLYGVANLQSGASSPTNNATMIGAMNLMGCLLAGTCEPCDDGVFCNGSESCAGSACVAGAACMLICDEGAETCVECNVPADCDDDNPCTDDSCMSNSCMHVDNSEPCDDGRFCTATDQCSGGDCVGTGNPCGAENCSEGLDDCVDCLSPTDCNDDNPCTDETCTVGVCGNVDNDAACDDGFFCTANDQCSGGDCVGGGDPCQLGATCNEGMDQCIECAIDGDCDDGNDCTDDSCNAGTCSNTEAPVGRTCTSDNDFCNGVETCQDGVCTSGGAPCDANETCDEDTESCVRCGNIVVDVGESCDDGNTDDGDGCSSSCQGEDGFVCDNSVEPSVCTPDGAGGSGGEGSGGGGSAATPAPPEVSSGCDCRAGSGDGGGWLVLALVTGMCRWRTGRRRTRDRRCTPP